MAVFKKNGSFWIDYYCQGKRFREKVGASKTVANQALAKRKTQIAEQKFFPDRYKLCVNLRTMAAEFWHLYGRYRKGVSMPYMLKKLDAMLGDKTLDQLTIPLILEVLNRIRATTSVSTANRYHTLLRSIFNRAIDWGRFNGTNPLSKIRQGKEPQHRLRYLTKSEIMSILTACSDRIYPIVACAIMTGMRRGEILKLTWENLDLDQGVITVSESKSGNSRQIPIPPKLITVFEKIPKGDRISQIFDVSEDVLHSEFKKAMACAGISGFRFHDLRHTFASHFVMRTNDLPTLQKLLGHHSPMMTQRYAHLSKGHIQVGMVTFDSGLDSAWPIRMQRPIIGLQPTKISADC